VPAELADNFKAMPDINVVGHHGRLLALGEGDPPIELGDDLSTEGPIDFDGVIPGICAHPKIDPATGELVAFRYDIEEPYLTWSVVVADGSVTTAPQTIDRDTPCMIHDFAITESSIVIFIGPLITEPIVLTDGAAAGRARDIRRSWLRRP
jgi:carotenoid cleavage dioxygenase